MAVKLDKASEAALVSAQALGKFLTAKANEYTATASDAKTPPEGKREAFRKSVAAENAGKVLTSVTNRLEAGFFS